jgi:processive 1,2-diacylglycerol beta-glucosyltransferase
MPKILFLYATNNSGHQKAASAIIKSLHHLAPKIQTIEIDFFTHHYPKIGPYLFKVYLEIMQSIPDAWDYIYDSPGVAAMTSELRQFFNTANIPKLQQILKEHKPSLIVCTQAVPAGFVASEKEQGRVSVPFFVTITDFVANPYWPASQVNNYFVPDEEIKRSLQERSIPENRIKVTGIPVDNGFYHRIPKTTIRRQLGLKPNLFTVLIMGGSQGLGQIAESIEQLIVIKNLQLIIVAGSNKPLWHFLKKHYNGNKSVLVYGYVKNTARLMDASDILVSKPGGLTSAEAMVKGLPMIIVSPLPGQEERNAAYLIKNGIAERCNNIAKLPEAVESFLVQPEKLKTYQSCSLNKGKPFAGFEIANHLLRYIS